MKQNTFKWFSLILIFLLNLSSCKKEELAKMEKGRYKMTHVRTFSNGQQENFHCIFRGPSIGDHSYFFEPETGCNGAYSIEVYKKAKKSKSKKYQKVKFYLDSPLLEYPEYFYGVIDWYDLRKDELVIMYSNSEYAFSGVIHLTLNK